MKFNEAIEQVSTMGGFAFRETWDNGTGIDLEDIVAEDWEVYIEEQSEDQPEEVED